MISGGDDDGWPEKEGDKIFKNVEKEEKVEENKNIRSKKSKHRGHIHTDTCPPSAPSFIYIPPPPPDLITSYVSCVSPVYPCIHIPSDRHHSRVVIMYHVLFAFGLVLGGGGGRIGER